MQMLHGKVRELLFSSVNELYGFVTNGGAEVHFAEEKSNLVRAILSVGSSVEILGRPCEGNAVAWLDADWIGNLDRGSCVNLSNTSSPHEPETSFAELSTPEEAVSLAPPLTMTKSGAPDRASMLSDIDRERACESIGSAFDALHRAQALLAYVKILGHEVSPPSDLLKEAKRAYHQALAHYAHEQHPVAFEYALASCELAFTVETGATRMLAFDVTSPTLVPLPPLPAARKDDAIHLSHTLSALSTLLMRVRWVLANGTLAMEDREQVSRLVSRAESFYGEALRFQKLEQVQPAKRSAQKGGAIARSAEHICRQAYLYRSSGSGSVKRSVA